MQDDSFGGPAIGRRFSPAARSPLTGGMFTPGSFHPGSAAPASDPNDPFGMFDDPSTRYLTNTIKQQIGEYSKPVSFDPNTLHVLDFLKGQMAGGAQGASANPLLGDFITEGRKRIAELNEEPFSANEENALRTRAKDQITQDRDAQKHAAMEEISRRGMADSSGALQERLAQIDRGYTSADAKAINDLTMYIADQRQQRKTQAASIAGQLSQAGAQEAARSDSMRQASQAQIMQAASIMANLEAQRRGESRANQQQVLNMAAMLAQLPIDRMNMALGIINGTGGGAAGASSLFNNTLALSNTQGRANENAASGTDAFLQGLASLATYFANRPSGGKK